jgi:hypothetical protein
MARKSYWPIVVYTLQLPDIDDTRHLRNNSCANVLDY